MNKRLVFSVLLILSWLSNYYPAFSCTTAIISGKSTVDGRPLLFKHRDVEEPDNMQNKLMFFNDGMYEYIGLVNSKDTLGEQVWAGCNSSGFAIMNAASYNLNINDTTSVKDREGIFMKQALQTCATIVDFQKLIDISPKPLGLESNFGVIDAKGGAAYYEIGNYKYTKFDANDSLIAPFGYIIRTNFSFSGKREADWGLIRYQTTQELFNSAYETNSLSYKFLIKDVSRCFKHSLTKNDISEYIPSSDESRIFVDFREYIPRVGSSSTFIVQGVKKDESPSLTTIWTILGFQLCSIAVPTWVSGGKDLLIMLLADTSGNAPLCNMALKLKEKLFPYKNDEYYQFINVSPLFNKSNNGIMQILNPVENRIIEETEKKLDVWRKKGLNVKEIPKYYNWLDNIIRETYKNSFNLF